MTQPVYLMIGVPGSGKSWVASRVGDSFEYVANDDFIGAFPEYLSSIIEIAQLAEKPVLAEAPFSVSQIKEPLEQAGIKVHPVILYEDKNILTDRYENDPKRDGKPIPKGHITRMETYKSRAREYNAFVGNSSQVLEHLKRVGG